MTFFVAGIDGGQSSTIAAIGDRNGRVVGRGRAGPSDEIGAGADSSRLSDALHGALADACRSAGLPDGSEFAAIVAGVSGYNGHVYGQAPALRSPRFLLMHDAPVAHAGALGGAPGVIVIAGTGSVVYARDATGSERTLGGWGYLFGDEGSAFRIARDALEIVMGAQDEGDASFAAETQAACAFFGRNTLRELGRAFYHDEIPRDRLASFAPEALRFARFRTAAYAGADWLARLAVAAIAAAGAARVALCGGVFSDAGFRRRLSDGVRAAVSNVEIVSPRYDAAAGALLLAYRASGSEIAELVP